MGWTSLVCEYVDVIYGIEVGYSSVASMHGSNLRRRDKDLFVHESEREKERGKDGW